MAVGAVIDSLSVRWMATFEAKPSETNVSCSEVRGALDGSASFWSDLSVSSKTIFLVAGLEVNNEEMTTLSGRFVRISGGCHFGSGCIDSTRCLFGACSSAWFLSSRIRFLCWLSTLRRSRHGPPFNTVLGAIGPVGAAKLRIMPSSAIVSTVLLLEPEILIFSTSGFYFLFFWKEPSQQFSEVRPAAGLWRWRLIG